MRVRPLHAEFPNIRVYFRVGVPDDLNRLSAPNENELPLRYLDVLYLREEFLEPLSDIVSDGHMPRSVDEFVCIAHGQNAEYYGTKIRRQKPRRIFCCVVQFISGRNQRCTSTAAGVGSNFLDQQHLLHIVNLLQFDFDDLVLEWSAPFVLRTELRWGVRANPDQSIHRVGPAPGLP